MQGSSKFYNEQVTPRREAIDQLIEEIANSFVSETHKDPEFLARVQSLRKQVEKLGNFKEEFPAYRPQPTSKQVSSAMSAKKHCYHYASFTQQVIEEYLEDEDLEWLLELKKAKIPPKVKYYLEQAQRCYYFECWDACIVMIARAIEYSLKDYLSSKKVSYSGFPTLGNLKETYGKYVDNEDIIKYIVEVQKMDRNICAHDCTKERQQMTKDEADHSWTAIRIIIKELLKVSIPTSK